jgi:hypothetical protein
LTEIIECQRTRRRHSDGYQFFGISEYRRLVGSSGKRLDEIALSNTQNHHFGSFYEGGGSLPRL